ncbi:unnamed protein product [Prunus brigantina]
MRVLCSGHLLDGEASFLIASSFASCYASLFDAVKLSIIACSNRVPFGVIMTTPAPAPFWFDTSSMHNCHVSLLNTGCLAPSSSRIKVELTAELDTARYTNKSLPGTSFESRGGEVSWVDIESVADD